MRNNYHIYAAVTVALWSAAYIYSRMAMAYLSPSSLGFLRYLVASAALLILIPVLKIHPPRRKDLPWIALSGATGFFGYMITFNMGARLVSSATGSVIIALAPVVTALMATLLYRERLRTYQWGAIAIEFVGIILLTMLDGEFSMNVGVLWLFGAVLMLSCYNLVQRRLTRRYSGLQVTTYSIFIGTVMLSVFGVSAAKEAAQAPPVLWYYLVVLGVACGAVAYVTWAQAYQKAKDTTSVSNYMFLNPFATSLAAFLVAGEVPSWSTVLGGSVILGGAFLFHLENFLPHKVKA